jgi:hypothetical protein
MNSTVKYIIALCTLLISTGCSRCNDFENGDVTNDGIIAFDITLSRCYGTSVAREQNGGMHMRSRAQFLNFFPKRTSACAIGDSLELDFSVYDLLSYPTEGVCNTKIERSVEINEAAKEVIYSVIQEDCGRCGTQNFNNNLVAIPKVEDGYVVRYQFDKR